MTPRLCFVFTVNGERAGVIYVTVPQAREMRTTIERARRLAIKRSGDPAPVLIGERPDPR